MDLRRSLVCSSPQKPRWGCRATPRRAARKRRQAISVWAADELESLALQHRRTGVRGHPGIRIHDELDAHKPHNAVGGFINKRFRMRGVDLTSPTSAPWTKYMPMAP